MLKPSVPDFLAEVLAYIEAHREEPLTVAELAAETVMPANARVEMRDGLVRRDAFTVAGVGALFNEDNKSGIPGLWPRLIRVLPLKGQADTRTYGVCAMVDKQEGALRYIAGVEVAGDAPLPDGFERIALDAHSYAVFRLTLDGGALHPQMQAAMPKIWGELLPQSGLKTVPAPDFELYPADFEPMRKGSYVDMYIAVEA